MKRNNISVGTFRKTDELSGIFDAFAVIVSFWQSVNMGQNFIKDLGQFESTIFGKSFYTVLIIFRLWILLWLLFFLFIFYKIVKPINSRLFSVWLKLFETQYWISSYQTIKHYDIQSWIIQLKMYLYKATKTFVSLKSLNCKRERKWWKRQTRKKN